MVKETLKRLTYKAKEVGSGKENGKNKETYADGQENME
jgi:hypothetical protein